MRILIYLGHPAQYHFFKNVIKILQNNGHYIIILLKTKDVLEPLVQQDGLEYINIQTNVRKNNVISMALASISRVRSVYMIAKREKIDVLIGEDSSIAQAAKLLKKFAITTTEDDIDVIKKLAVLTYPYTNSIVCPEVCSVGRWSNKKIPYYGYMKLAYLHPNRFTPDISIVEKYIKEKKYCIVRLAQLTAFHDIGICGLNTELVYSVIEIAKKYGYTIYISSEGKLDNSLKQYQLSIKYSDIHHIMGFSSLLISDSQSMSVESSILGVPSIRFSDFAGKISVLEELEYKYHLTFGVKTNEVQRLYNKVEELLSINNIQKEFKYRRDKMLFDKIDVTSFLVWFVENYPESRRIMKENPDYQYRFK